MEGVGNKLKDLLPNTNPWRGAHCGRKCIPCDQEGDTKQDCRKRSIIYENICIICNPGEMTNKGKKDGKELADLGEMPSIYVGESGSRLHERAQDHWNDFASEKPDSHILKHWLTHHQGQGTPQFRIRVIKYCRDALTRQVGEAVRISYRGQTLNSKAGYNRSGISRLVVEEREVYIPEPEEEVECAEPRGLQNLPGAGKLETRESRIKSRTVNPQRREEN